jgi:hypothetical protein
MPTEFILKEEVNGNAANGTLYFDITGTSTPKPVYQDALKTIPWPYPIPLNAQGMPNGNVYLAGGGYRMTVRNSSGAILPGFPNDGVGVADGDNDGGVNWTGGVTGTTTVASSGISDAVSDAELAAFTLPFASITGKPTTLAGYGITDGVTDAELAANSTVTSVAPGYTGTTTQRSTSFVSSNGAPTTTF